MPALDIPVWTGGLEAALLRRTNAVAHVTEAEPVNTTVASPIAVARREPFAYRFWVPVLVSAFAGVALRLPFARVPLTPDEGGYAEVARLWAHGARLYQGVWVDRPQLLLLVFRGADSLARMRVLAGVLAFALTILVALIARELFGARAATVAAVLAGVFGLSPLIEAFVLNGELIAAVPAALAVLLYLRWAAGRTIWLLVAAALLAGTAVMVKQSAFDAFAVILICLVWRERRFTPIAVFLAGALAPAAASILAAPSGRDWWYAIVGYRAGGHGDTLLSGSGVDRLQLLVTSLPAAAWALGPSVALAFVGRRRIPFMVKAWLAAGALGVLGGGRFLPHYYLQLVAPLAVAGAAGYRDLAERRVRRRFAVALVALGALALAPQLRLTAASASIQTSSIYPGEAVYMDRGPALASYVRAHSGRRATLLALTAGSPVVYWLANRPPASPYLWPSNINDVPGAQQAAFASLRSGVPRFLVLQADQVPATGGVAGYRRVTQIGPFVLFERTSVAAGPGAQP